jgi:NAD(P)-dependent dehydrogenase (short-subunit alcohol dehydrogenase family)
VRRERARRRRHGAHDRAVAAARRWPSSADVGKEADVERVVAEGVRKFRALHVLYNNAGVLWKDRDRSVLETSSDNWDRVQAINLKGPFFVAKHGIPHLIRARGGSIINIGSVSALAGFTVAQDSYTSAKGALIALTRSLAIQFARRNVRCQHHPPRHHRDADAGALPEGSGETSFVRGIHPARSHRAPAGDRAGRAVPRLRTSRRT